jgi:hypothetical protein
MRATPRVKENSMVSHANRRPSSFKAPRFFHCVLPPDLGKKLGSYWKRRPPSTFQEALKQGWAVVSDKSKQSINQKRREGELTMQERGSAGLLEVDYVGTTKGYRFSVPKFAS